MKGNNMAKWQFLLLKSNGEKPDRHAHIVDLSQYGIGDAIDSEGTAEDAMYAHNEMNHERNAVDGDLIFNKATGAWWRISPKGIVRTFPIGEMPVEHAY